LWLPPAQLVTFFSLSLGILLSLLPPQRICTNLRSRGHNFQLCDYCSALHKRSLVIRTLLSSRPYGIGGIKRCCASDVWRLSVTYIGPKSRTERPMTKIGTEVAHVTRDSDTTFKVKMSGQLAGGWGRIVAASSTGICLIILNYCLLMVCHCSDVCLSRLC